ncbi:MAG: EFR1 family ferrodoxin [Candidatus Tenebribacter davisii]|jgi:ferredoxin|nr:EFR1 family ferrodoxin [Candidatus Tenebribacter davisii]
MHKIFYFTGSGNSLAIAKRIGEKIGQYKVVKVTSKLDFNKPVKADILGFVFPVYAWGMPVLFKKFLEQIEISKAKYIFVVTNYAGNGGNVLGLFQKLMKKKNINIDAFFEIFMPSNYLVMGDADPQDKAAQIIKNSIPKIEECAQKIYDRKMVPMQKVSFMGKLYTKLIYPLFANYIKRSDKNFFFTELCNGCGICEKVCPVENIILNENKNPVWQNHCEQCHACIHWCPQRAIEFSKKTSNKNRYTHPDVKVSELI